MHGKQPITERQIIVHYFTYTRQFKGSNSEADSWMAVIKIWKIGKWHSFSYKRWVISRKPHNLVFMVNNTILHSLTSVKRGSGVVSQSACITLHKDLGYNPWSPLGTRVKFSWIMTPCCSIPPLPLCQ